MVLEALLSRIIFDFCKHLYQAGVGESRPKLIRSQKTMLNDQLSNCGAVVLSAFKP